MTEMFKEEQMQEEATEETVEETAEEAAAEETTEAAAETVDTPAEDPEEEAWSMKYMRLMADFQNHKKRTEKEKSDIYSYANEKMATELLTVLDNFERALDHECSDDGFKEGMDMIFKQLFDALGKAGLAEIPALGEEFDPNFHNAVMTEDTDEYESGKVSGVLQKGYTLNGKVIRPTMVKVAN